MKIGNTEYRELLKKQSLKLSKKNAKQFNEIYRIHQGTKNFFSLKSNLIMFFIMQGSRSLLPNKPLEEIDIKVLLQQIDDYIDSHNLEEGVIRMNDLLDVYGEMVYYLAIQCAPDVKLIQNPDRLTQTVTYLLNKGMDAIKDQEETLLNSYLTETLLEYF